MTWLAVDPGRSAADITAIAAGFSRGGPTAVVFTQLLAARGLVGTDGTVLFPPLDPRTGLGGVPVSGLLGIDNVSTGYIGDLRIPQNVNADNIVMVVAENEFRRAFLYDDYRNDPRVKSYPLVGNHGDAGGFYDNGLGSLALEATTNVLRNFGLTLADVPPDRQFDPNGQVVIHSEGVDHLGQTIWSEYGWPGNRLFKTVPGPVLSDLFSSDVAKIAAVSNGDQTLTQQITYKNGEEIYRLIDANGNPLLTATVGEQISRDPGTGVYSVHNVAQSESSTYDPGTRTYSQVNSSGVAIEGNSTTGEYRMSIPDGKGGTIVYSKQLAADGNYAISEIQSDKNALITYQFTGTQNAVTGEVMSSLGMTRYGDDSLHLNASQQVALGQQLAQLKLGEIDLRALPSGSVAVMNSDGIVIGHIEKNPDGTVRYLDSKQNGFEIDADGKSQPVTAGLNLAEQLERQQAQQLQASFGAVQSALALIQALESGNTLAATTAGVAMVNQVLVAGGSIPAELKGLSDSLRAGGAVLGAVSAAMNLADALKSGDALGILQSSANLGAQGIGLWAMANNITLIDSSGQAVGGMGQAAQGLGIAAAGVSLAMAIESGNVASMASSTVNLLASMGCLGPYGPVAAVVLTLFTGMIGTDQPMLEGQAQVEWDAGGNIHVVTTQDSEGGGATATRWMQSLVDGLQKQLASMVDASGQPLYGLIAARVPSIGFQYDPDGFNFANGAVGHLYLKWTDENGQLQTRYYDGAGSRGDGSGDSMASDFMRHAMQAVVPAWEAQTVLHHYLKEGIDATALPGARAGMPVEDAAHLTQSFTTLTFASAPVESAANERIYVDIDGDGYLEKVDWVAANQAMLAIDLNGDGKITVGELLNPDSAATLERNSIRWLDANSDGILNASDPAFTALRLWIDANHDGVSQGAMGSAATELQSLSSAGITAIDFRGNPPSIVRADGSVTELTVRQLTGDVKGVAYLMTAGGLLESTEGGPTVLHAINTREFDGQAVHTHGGGADTDGNGGIALVINKGDLRLVSTSSKSLPGASQRDDTTLAANDARITMGVAGSAISGQSDGQQSATIGANSSQVRGNPLAFLPGATTSAEQELRQVRQEMVRNADNALFGLSVTGARLVAMGAAAGALQWPAVASADSLNRPATASAEPQERIVSPDSNSGAIHADSYLGNGRGDSSHAALDPFNNPLTDLFQSTNITSTGNKKGTSSLSLQGIHYDDAAQTSPPSVTAAKNVSSGPMQDERKVEHDSLSFFSTKVPGLAAPDGVTLVYPTVAGEMVAGTEDIGLRLPEAMLLANDSTANAPAFLDRQSLRITSAFSPSRGQVALRTGTDGLTEAIFIPEANFHGVATFSYTVTDQYGLSSVATTTVVIDAVNDAPVVRDELASGNEDTVLQFRAADLLANDSDADSAVDGDVLRVSRVGQARHGQVFLDSDGTIRFVPDRDYNGPAQFTYWVADRQDAQLAANGGAGHEIAGTMYLTVVAVNDLPVVKGEQIDSDEDMVLDINPALLLANDTDADLATNGQALSITAVGNARHGSVQLLDDGTIRFIPELNYFGVAAFSYTVDDGNGGRVVGTTVLNLAPVNDAPDVTGETVTFDEDSIQTIASAALLANDSDVDNSHSDLRIVSVDNATHGVVTMSADGSIRFVPEEDYFGAASFTYTVSDGAGGFTIGTASLAIQPVNDAPRLQGENASVSEDQVLHFSFASLLANDADVDNAHGDLNIAQVGSASHGKVSVVNGEIVFVPDLNYFGQAGFTYTVDDGAGGKSQAQVSITLNPVNDLPVVNNEFLAGKYNLTYMLTQAALLANDTDVENPAGLIISSVQNATHGTVGLNANGTITFVPETGFAGTGSFEYVVRDPDGGEAVGKTEIDFSHVNINPVAVDDSFTGFEDTAFIIASAQLTINDTDPDPTFLPSLSVAAVANASNGVASLLADGSVQFMPSKNFSGTASFQYLLSDNDGGATWATAYLNVQSVNDAPVIEDIWYGKPIYGYKWTTHLGYDESGVPNNATWVLAPVTDESTAIALAANPLDRLSHPYAATDKSNDLVDANGNPVGLSYYLNGHLRPIAFDTIDATVYDEYSPSYIDDPYRQSGKVIAFDPDGNSDALSFAIAAGPQHGHAWANQYTSIDALQQMDHTQTEAYAVAEKGAWQYYSHRGDPYSGSDPFSLRVTDSGGATTDAMIKTAHTGSSVGSGGKCPIVIDLDGDGIELVKPENSHMFADLNGDGWRERIGWASTDDGLLAFDSNHDGRISRNDEISFVGYKEGARTDLDGLAAFDTDGDGKLTAKDSQWASFGILRDLNRNGVQDEGELVSLDQTGITSIGLTRNGTPHLSNDSVVFGASEVIFADGHCTEAGDVMFAGQISVLPDEVLEVLAGTSSVSAVPSTSSTLDLELPAIAKATSSSTPTRECDVAAASGTGITAGLKPSAEVDQFSPSSDNTAVGPFPKSAAAMQTSAGQDDASPVAESQALDELASLRQMANLFIQAVATWGATADPSLGHIPISTHELSTVADASTLATDQEVQGQLVNT